MARLSEDQKRAVADDIRATIGTALCTTRKLAARHATSEASVRRIAAQHGLTLGTDATRAIVKNAVEVKRDNAARQRAEISAMLLDEAREAVLDMRRPATIYNFGGKDNTYNEKQVSRPPTGDRRNLAIIAGTLLDKHKMLDGYDASQHLASAVDDWLGDMLGRRAQE